MNACKPPKARGASARGIPAYTANGLRLRNYSLAAIQKCLALTPPSVVVKRNKRTGRITSAQFLPLPANSSAVAGKEPLFKTMRLGQRYSFAQRVDGESGRTVWCFVKFFTPRELLLDPEVTSADIERYLRLMFQAVPLSCSL